MDMNIPYGYDLIDGKLVPNELKAEIVKWLFTTVNKYVEHPPACLVYATMEYHRETYNAEMTYEEAEEKVPYGDILNYVCDEVNNKIKIFQSLDPSGDIEKLQELLSLSYEEAVAQASLIPDKERKPQYSYCISSQLLRDTVLKGKNRGISVEHTPIISPEIFKEATKVMATRRAVQSGIGVIGSDDLVNAGGAICDFCGQRKLLADGCSCAYVECGGKQYKRIPFGEENFEWAASCCHDCGVRDGFYHHPGCDVEECPVCGGQLIGCSCEIEFVEETV